VEKERSQELQELKAGKKSWAEERIQRKIACYFY
jgi:hypothetical protein